jgi:hypothetical protein
MDQMSAALAEPMRQSPLYAQYERLAPRVEDWPVLIGKISDALKVDYDWTADIGGSRRRTLLVYADADSVRPRTSSSSSRCSAAACATRGWDISAQPSNQLAILPGRTHYDVYLSPAARAGVVAFLDDRRR